MRDSLVGGPAASSGTVSSATLPGAFVSIVPAPPIPTRRPSATSPAATSATVSKTARRLMAGRGRRARREYAVPVGVSWRSAPGCGDAALPVVDETFVADGEAAAAAGAR